MPKRVITYDTGKLIALAAGTAKNVLVSGGAGADPSFGALDLASSAAVGTSVLPIANGGTNNDSTGGNAYTTYGSLYYDGTRFQTTSSSGTTGQYLKSNDNTGAPTWADVPYDVAGMVAGKPNDGATIFYFKATRAFTLSATSANHVFTAATAATASSVFTVKRNASTILTATFAASGTVATISAVSNNAISDGDIITVVAPSPQDATIADVYWTLSGAL